MSKKAEAKRDWQRTHYCGELRKEHVGQLVTVMGWVQKLRDIGNLIFVDLRDRAGTAQIVFSSEDQSLLEEAKKIRGENVIGIRGLVKLRDEGARNPQLPTGEIDIQAQSLIVFNKSKVPPFVIGDPPQASEELRFKFRYLDMRRPAMQRNLKLRHQAALSVRNFLDKNGFLEIETPFLTKSTPEGARDYLVPSRMYKGRFYALPQSPQLFKQMLMIAGFDRYFQIVRCFRDEDLRADRQPEFTQIDIEMSFVAPDDVFEVTENLMDSVFSLIGVKVERPIPRLTYTESMEKYGTDAPDLRFGMEIHDLTTIGSSIDSEIMKRVISSGGVLRGLFIEEGAEFSRRQLSDLDDKAKKLGGKGVIWVKKLEEYKSSLKVSETDLDLIWKGLNGTKQGLALLVADKKDKALKVLGEIRKDLITALYQEKNKVFQFCWITDFPLFEWSEEEGRAVSVHHPFTSPLAEDISLLEKEPLSIRAHAYDLVLNGVEIGGGSIRIHDEELQKRVFSILGLSEVQAEEKFGFFVEALKYGTPPHGGIALGFDRIVMIVAGEESIREVIPFPKTTSALCLLTESPAEVEARQLEELGLKKIEE
jgi:aspartyl-tRNA synthetase